MFRRARLPEEPGGGSMATGSAGHVLGEAGLTTHRIEESRMHRALQITVNQTAHDIDVDGHAGIAEVLRQRHVESLAADSAVDFWFAPSTITAQRLNIFATDLFLMATTNFGAANVPLFYGDVVVASHNSIGGLADLTRDQVARLRGSLGWRREWVLGWRYDFAARRAKRTAQAQVCDHVEKVHRGF